MFIDRIKALFFLNALVAFISAYRLLNLSLFILLPPKPSHNLYQIYQSLISNPVVIFWSLFGYALISTVTIYSLYRGRKLYASPAYTLLESISKDLYEADPNNRCVRLAREICTALGVDEPKILMTKEDIPNIISASSRKKKFILIPELISANLNDEELKAVLAHEIWHIRSDLTFVTYWNVLFDKIYLILPLVIYNCFAFSLLFIEETILPIFFYDVTISLVIFAIFWLVFSLPIFIRISSAMFREYEADCVSYIITRNSDALISALRKMTLLNFIIPRLLKIPTVCFLNPKDNKQVLESKCQFDEIFPRNKLKLLIQGKRHVPVSSRIRLIKLLDKLTTDHLSFEYINRRVRWYFPLTPFENEIKKIPKNKVKEALKIIKSNCHHLNVTEISSKIGLDELRICMIIFCLLRDGVLVPSQINLQKAISE